MSPCGEERRALYGISEVAMTPDPLSDHWNGIPLPASTYDEPLGTCYTHGDYWSVDCPGCAREGVWSQVADDEEEQR